MPRLSHPRLAEIERYLDAVRADLVALVDATPAARLSAPRADASWNGAQVVQHLGKVEGSTAKYLEGVFAKALEAGVSADGSSASVMGSLERYLQGDGSFPKLIAPERLVPDASPPLEENWASLLAVRERLFKAYAPVDGRDLTAVSAQHPRLGLLNGYEWLLFIGRHEERHIAQIRRSLGAA